MKIFLVFTLLTLLISLADCDQIFPDLSQNHVYEKFYRALVKQDNLYRIQMFNDDAAHNFQLRQNKFISLTNEQFLSLYTVKNKHPQNIQVSKGQSLMTINESLQIPLISSQISLNSSIFQPSQSQSINIDLSIPNSFIHDQGTCHSCYSYSTIATLQNLLHLQYGIKYDLSQQQIIQCTRLWGGQKYKNYNNNGCEGGWGWKAYHYMKFRGVTLQDEYPYIAGKNKTVNMCDQTTISKKRFRIKDYKAYYDNQKPQKQCEILHDKLREGLTVAVSIYVPPGIEFQFYGSKTSGIDIFDICGPYTTVNHQLQLVGATDQYWKLKNSYGIQWGQQGYLYLDKTKGLNCLNVCMDFAYATGVNTGIK